MDSNSSAFKVYEPTVVTIKRYTWVHIIFLCLQLSSIRFIIKHITYKQKPLYLQE